MLDNEAIFFLHQISLIVNNIYFYFTIQIKILHEM